MIPFFEKLCRSLSQPTDNLDVRATRLAERMDEVVPAIAAVVPEAGSLDRCLINLLKSQNPWGDKQNLADLAEIAARLNFATCC